MTFPIEARVVSTMPVADIIGRAPEGQVPVFYVIKSSDDNMLGCQCYMTADGAVYDCITRKRVNKRLITGLTFDRYTETP